MRIAILTLPLHTNYGGILQAYALQAVLERMGHIVTVISVSRFHKVPCGIRSIPLYSLRIIKRLFGQGCVLKEKRNNEKILKMLAGTEHFINNYINERTICSFSEIGQEEYDTIIVGSDQIWNPQYFKKSFKGSKFYNAFLGFTKRWDINRIAYAVSGLDEWNFTENEKNEYAQMASLFSALSVREFSSIDIIKNILGIENVVHTLDPTMLLEKDDYINLIRKNKTPKSEGTMMYYILDRTDEKMQLVNKVCRDYSFTPFTVGWSNETKSFQSIEQWLRGFMDAEFIVTDSFHGCVFSIIFGKPFIAIANKSRGLTRFTSLLSKFSLESNLLMTIDDYNPSKRFDLNQQTSYILEKERKKSMSFLLNNL